MRLYRVTFVLGLGTGFILGAQAGRERYEQMKQLARKASENPTVQQAAGALQAQATAAAKSAKAKTATGIRKGTSTVSKRRPGRTAGRKPTPAGNGSAASAGNDYTPFVPVNGKLGQPGPM